MTRLCKTECCPPVNPPKKGSTTLIENGIMKSLTELLHVGLDEGRIGAEIDSFFEDTKNLFAPSLVHNLIYSV